MFSIRFRRCTLIFGKNSLPERERESIWLIARVLENISLGANFSFGGGRRQVMGVRASTLRDCV